MQLPPKLLLSSLKVEQSKKGCYHNTAAQVSHNTQEKWNQLQKHF